MKINLEDLKFILLYSVLYFYTFKGNKDIFIFMYYPLNLNLLFFNMGQGGHNSPSTTTQLVETR